MAAKGAFGVGSFHFAWRVTASSSAATFRQYRDELTAALNGIQTVSNLSIDFDEKTLDSELSIEEIDWEEGEGFFPPLSFATIDFDLLIAERFQKEILEGSYAETGTERFRVHQIYGYHSPLTIVQPLGTDKDPSTTVVVVREYLRSHLALSGRQIALQALGPSPFHADFFVVPRPPGATADSPFSASIEASDAYDHVTIYYDTAQYKEAEAALEDLVEELHHELCFCYSVYAANARAIKKWESVSAAVDQLLDADATSRFQRLKRALRRGHHLSRLHQQMAEFEAASVADSYDTVRDRKQLQRVRRPVSLEPLIDQALADRFEFPLAQYEKLVGHIEAKRSRAIEIIVVLLAAVVGGALGSVITLLAQ